MHSRKDFSAITDQLRQCAFVDFVRWRVWKIAGAWEAENKRLREALGFYAREANWRTTTKYMSGRSGQTSVEIDRGSRARQALAALAAEGGA